MEPNQNKVNVRQQVDPSGKPTEPTDAIHVEPVGDVDTVAPATAKPTAPKEVTDTPVEAERFADDAREAIASSLIAGREADEAQLDEEMTPGEKKHVERMELEARGDDWEGVVDGDMGDADPLNQAEMEVQPAVAGAQKNLTEGVDLSGGPVTIVVFGEKIDVTAQEVEQAGGVASLQKSKAADIRLSRIASYGDDLRDWEHRLQNWSVRLNAGQTERHAATDAAPVDETGPDMSELAKTIVTSLYAGNEDEAAGKLASALSELTRRGQNQSAIGTPEELRILVREELDSRQVGKATEGTVNPNEERAAASATFRVEFPDVQNDPTQHAACLAEIGIVQRDPMFHRRPLDQVVREAGYRTRAKFAGIKIPATPSEGTAPVISLTAGQQIVPTASSTAPVTAVPGATANLQQRYTLKKRTVVAPSTASIGAPSPDDSDPQRTSGADIVAGMREARGLPPQ